MKKLVKILLGAVLAASGDGSIHADELIEPFCIVDGVEVSLDQPVYSEGIITFKAAAPQDMLDWKVTMALEGDRVGSGDAVIAESTQPSSEFLFDINSVDWSRFESMIIKTDDPRMFEEGYNVIGYRLSVTASSGNGSQCRQFVYALPLIPTTPVLLSQETGEIDFNYETNWYRNLVPFSFKCKAERAQSYEVVTSQFHLFRDTEKKARWALVYPELEPDEEGNLNFLIEYSEWGTFVAVYAINEYGRSGKLLMNTSDFITDPEILARLDELREEMYPGVSVDRTPVSPLRIEGDRISVPDGVASLAVIGLNGTCLREYAGGGSLSTEDLPAGIYILRYGDAKGTHSLKYLKR